MAAGGKRYSAGAIFLQVVPVFQDVQRMIEREAKNWDKTLGNEMEDAGERAGKRAGRAMSRSMSAEMASGAQKAGKEAGEKYAGHFETRLKQLVKNAQREIATINFDTATEKSLRDLERVQAALAKISDQRFDVDFDAKKVLGELEMLEATVAALTKHPYDINIHANLREVERDLIKAREMAEAVSRDQFEVRFGFSPDLRQMDREIGSFEKRFKAAMKSAGDSIGDSVEHRLAQVRTEMQALGDAEINIDLDAASAIVQAREIQAYLSTVLQDQTITIDARNDAEIAVRSIREFLDEVDKIKPRMGTFERTAKVAMEKAADHIRRNPNREIQKLVAELEYLNGLRVGVDVSVKDFQREFFEVMASLQALERSDVDIDVRLDSGAALGEMAAVQTALDSVSGNGFERSIRSAMLKAAGYIRGSVDPALEEIDRKLTELSLKRVGIDISSADARAEVATLRAQLERLSKKSPDVQVRFDAGKAFAELALWEKALDKADGRNVNARASFFGLRSVSRDSDQAANSFRAFNVIALAVATLGPALVPVLGAIAGALAAIAPAAAVAVFGLSSVIVGFSGIGNALQALQARQDQQGKTAQTAAKQNRDAAQAIADAQRGIADAERNAARAAADAARRVADARRAAAQAVKDALRQQKDAQEAYADSVREVKDAEQALAEARAAAAGTGDDLADQINSNRLDIQQAILDSFDATNQYNAVMADGSSTNAEQIQAEINRDRALQALKDLRDEQRRLAEEKKKWDKDGVDGVESVQDAQESLNDAIDQQRDAYEALRDAARGVDEARREGARQVADALRAQNQVLADNKRSIEDARRALVRARQAQDDVNESINAQEQAVDAAFAKLGPAGRKFALFLFGLRSGFRDFRDDVQRAMLPSIQRAIEGFLGSGNASIAREALVSLARSFGKFAEALSRSFQGPAWTGFFEMLRDLGPSIQRIYGDAFISFFEAIASLLTHLGPHAKDFAIGLSDMMDSFAKWAASEKGAKGVEDFMAYAREVGPDVLSFIGAFAKAAVSLGAALAEWGDLVLTSLSGFLNMLSNMDPALLSAIITSLFVLIAASQVAYAIMNLLFAGAALLGTTVGVWVFAIVGIVAALAFLYKQNAGFRDFVKKAWAEISESIQAAWKTLKPALQELGASLSDLWKRIIVPAFKAIAPIMVAIAKIAIRVLLKAFEVMVEGITIAIKIVIPVLEALWTAIEYLWKYVAKPVLWALKMAWRALSTAISFAWNKILKPIFVTFGKILWNLWKGQAKVVFVLVKAGFKAMGVALKWVWSKVIWPMLKGLAAGFKWVWEKSKPILGWIGDRFTWLGDLFGWFGDEFEKIKNWFVDEALPDLKKGFKNTIEGIGNIWDDLKKIVGVPVKFIIETVMNDGLIAGFNKVANWVNVDGFDPIPIPNWMKNYATGGILPGYTPGRDPHKFYSPTGGRLELSGGEAIMRPEFTRAVGAGFVNTMNAAARTGGVGAIRSALGMDKRKSQAFANGGIVFPVRGGIVYRTPYNLGHDGMDINHPDDAGPTGQGGVVPFYSATGGTVSYVGTGRGYGIATFVVSPYGELVYGHAYPGSTTKSAGDPVLPGTRLGLIGNTGNSDGAHLHFGFPGGTFYRAEGLLAGSTQPIASGTAEASGGGGIKIPGWLMDIVKNPFGAVKGWITGGIDKATDAIKGPFLDIFKNGPLKLAEKATDKVWDIIPGWVKKAAGWAGDAAGWVAGGVKGALGVAGDVAGAAGDLADNLGFKDGGILPYNGTMKYDNGGYLPPGLTSVVNLTGKPEPVFTSDQWNQMGGSRPADGMIHYEPHFEGSNLTSDDVAADLNFTLRRLSRGGRYAGARP